MTALRMHASRQIQTLVVVGIALAAVLAYSVWGSIFLHSQQASASQPGFADNA